MSYLKLKQRSRDFTWVEKSCKPEQHVGYSPKQVASEDSSVFDHFFFVYRVPRTANSRFKSLIQKITKQLSTVYSAETHTASFLY